MGGLPTFPLECKTLDERQFLHTFFKSNNNHSVHFNPELIHYTYGQEEYYKIWGRTLYQTWHNRLYALKLWLQQIIQLQTMFDRYNKNYLMNHVIHLLNYF